MKTNEERLVEAIAVPLAEAIADLQGELKSLRRQLADVSLPATHVDRIEGLLVQVRALAEKAEGDAELVLRGYAVPVHENTAVVVAGACPLALEMKGLNHAG